VTRSATEQPSKIVSEPEAREPGGLDGNGQPQVKGWTAEILLLKALPGVRNIEHITGYRQSAERELELAAQAEIPIQRILRSIPALDASSRCCRY
jgi:hypothetical protein